MPKQYKMLPSMSFHRVLVLTKLSKSPLVKNATIHFAEIFQWKFCDVSHIITNEERAKIFLAQAIDDVHAFVGKPFFLPVTD